ncbi:MAG: L-threonylcarbamoyladenylate synthase [Bdellovibrionaceae bacterium]|nr:L-threonylcarbamoyladenylate synthase [Bdellovibrionales bacterium]MCB9254842.1 L-threonylcarbamoyladenylate synthase [Pseudobdellovibrionaceae bacterium]
MAPIYSIADPKLWEHLQGVDLRRTIWVSPTDTVYGFGTACSNPDGLSRIQKLKNVGPQPAIALVANSAWASDLVQISERNQTWLDRYWPGPISFILPKRSGDGTLALRCPDDEFLQRLLAAVGEAIYSTSCNRHGEAPAESAVEAISLFPDGVDFFIDGGLVQNLTPSTLVDLTGQEPKVLRRGPVSFD